MQCMLAFATPVALTSRALRSYKPRFTASATPPDKNFALHRRAFLVAGAAVAAGLTVEQLPTAAARTVSSDHEVLFDTSSGSFVPASSFKSLLKRKRGSLFDRCIIVGEIHDHPRTHDAQLAVLEGAASLGDGRPLVVGFEQFYRAHNPFLEQYSMGDISLEALLKVTSWKNTWGYDSALYAPIFEWCQQHGALMVGLNVPRRLVSFVSQFGLSGLTPELRAFLPPDIDTDNMAHFTQFLRLLGLSGHSIDTRGADMRQIIWRWYEAQCIWDEYMSETVALTVQKLPDARVVALIGSGHVEKRVGFPDCIEKRLAERPLTIVPREVRWTRTQGFAMPDIYEPEQNIADIVWYTNGEVGVA